MNHLFIELQAREHQHALLKEAHDDRLTRLTRAGFRTRVARWMRGVADKLEPTRPAQPAQSRAFNSGCSITG